jgi:hypothetical protein
MPYSFQASMRLCSSTTTPWAITERVTPAAKLPASPPSDKLGVTTASMGASTGSFLMASIKRG